MDKDEIIKQLQDENALLKEQLNKYLLKNKNYYENNKEEHKKRVKDYQEKTNYKATPEKQKEYNRISYLRRKERLKKEQEKIEENI
jgi:hypothetical protein